LSAPVGIRTRVSGVKGLNA